VGRKCLCCSLKNRAKLDAAIVEGTSSARVIGEQFRVSKKSVLGHRRHLGAELRTSQAGRASEIGEILKRVDRLIKLFSFHLKQKPKDALSLDWIRESRDQRGWLTFRVRAMGKAVPVDGAGKREGDKYVISFVAPDGKPAEIPLAVYRSLQKLQNCNSGSEVKETKELLSDSGNGCNEDVTKGGEKAAEQGSNDES
jgi:hypothetical protein